MDQFGDKFGKFIGALILFLIIVCVRAAVLGYPVMWLWNYTMPSMFGVAEIDFNHSLAFTVMCGIVFNHGNNSSKNKKEE